MEAKKLQIADVKRRFAESRKSVPAIEVDSDVVQGGSEGAGGVGGGAEGEDGFGVDLTQLSDVPDKSEEEEDAAEVLTSMSAGESGAPIGGVRSRSRHRRKGRFLRSRRSRSRRLYREDRGRSGVDRKSRRRSQSTSSSRS